MAIFSARASFIQRSRSKGQSAVAAAAYQAGERICDERTGQVYNYSSRADVSFKEILAPEGAPSWVFNRADLWNKVEQFEDELIGYRYRGHFTSLEKIEKSERAKEKALSCAQTAWKVIIALPRELAHEQNKEWLREFITGRFVSKGLAVDYAIHDEKGNPHAHLTVTLRALEDSAFSKVKETSNRKIGNIFDKAGLKETRRLIAEAINKALERYGFEDRVSHLSLKEQGISRLPTRHEGYHARHLEAQNKPSILIEETSRIRAFNLSQYLENPHLLLKDMSIEKASFTDKDLSKTIFELCDGDTQAYRALMSQAGTVRVDEGAVNQGANGIQFDSSLLKAAFASSSGGSSPSSLGPTLESYPASLFAKNTGFDARELKEMIEALKAKAALPSVSLEGLPLSHSLSGSLLKESGESAAQALARYLNTPDDLIRELAKLKVVFKASDIEKVLRGLVGDNEGLIQMLKDVETGKPAILSRPAANANSMGFTEQEKEELIKGAGRGILDRAALVIRLKSDFQGERVYTSHEQLIYEQKIMKTVEGLIESKGASLKDIHVSRAIEAHERPSRSKTPGFTYSLEQRNAIEHLTTGAQLRILTGRAGTGKTTVLKPVAAAYKSAGFRVKGIAFQGKVADALAREVGIQSSTIDSLLEQWKNYDRAKAAVESGKLWGKALNIQKKTLRYAFEHQWDKKTVVILDEGSMVGQGHYHQILEKAAQTGATLIIVQDGAQIKALHGADISRAIEEKAESVALSQVVRQRLPWMRDASALLNDHRVEEGLFHYEEQGRLHYAKDLGAAKREMTDAFLASYRADSSQTQMMLAFKNSDVSALNQMVFQRLREEGVLGQAFNLGGKTFAIGAEVVFTRNDARGDFVQPHEVQSSKAHTQTEGVFNGTFGRIVDYNNETQDVFIKLKANGQVVCLNEKVLFRGKNYTELELSFALTVNKAQGATFDKAMGLFDPLLNPNLFLVQCTRHREDFRYFVSSEQATNFREIAARVGASHYKPLTTDYHFEAGEEGAFKLVEAYKRASCLLADTCQKLQGDASELDSVVYGVIEPLKEKRDALALGILERWRETRGFAKQAHIREEVLETHAGLRERLLTGHARNLAGRIEEYYQASYLTRQCWEAIQRGAPGALSSEHPYYADFVNLREKRDALAALIVSDAQTAKPLFKVEYVKDEEGRLRHYKSYGGVEFDARPPPFKTALKQAAEYEKRKREEVLKDVLWGDRKDLHALALAYKTAFRKANHCYFDLKQEGPLGVDKSSGQERAIPLQPFVKLRLKDLEERASRERDELAFKVAEWLFEKGESVSHERFLKKLGIDADKLLTHAVMGEARFKIEKWEQAATLEERLALAADLKGAVFGEEGRRCNKSLYALAKQVEADPTRLRYESAYAGYLKEGGKSRFNSVQELKAAYSTLESYGVAHRYASSAWRLLQTGVNAHIGHVIRQQAEDFNALGWTQGLIVEEAAAEEAQKVANPQTLASLNAQLQGVVSAQNPNKEPHWSLSQVLEYADRIGGKAAKEEEAHVSSKTGLAASSASQTLKDSKPDFTQLMASVERMIDYSSLARHLLKGQNDLDFNNKLSKGKRLRFGKKGHFALDAEKGVWKNFKTGEGGNSWSLVKRYEGGNFNQQLETIKLFCRDGGMLIAEYLEGKKLSPRQTRDLADAQASYEEKRKKQAEKEAQDKESRKEAVGKLYAQRHSLNNTQAERYLKLTRKIESVDETENPDLSFLPQGSRFEYGGKSITLLHNSLAAFARDREAKLCAVQLTSLEGERKASISTAKRTYGVQAGAFVQIQRGEKTLWLAEGVETALSLKQAGFRGQIEAALGISNLKNREASTFETVVICADNDDHKPNSVTFKTVQEAKEIYESAGKTVYVVKPHIPGQDFNDVLKNEGADAVRGHFSHLTELQEVSLPSFKAGAPMLGGKACKEDEEKRLEKGYSEVYEKEKATPYASHSVEARSLRAATPTAQGQAPAMAAPSQRSETPTLKEDAYEWVLKGRDWMKVQGPKDPMVSKLK